MNGARRRLPKFSSAEGTEFLSCYPRNPLIEACAALDIRPILCRQERVGVGIARRLFPHQARPVNGVFAAQAGPRHRDAFPGHRPGLYENVPDVDHSRRAAPGAAIRAARCFAAARCLPSRHQVVGAGAFPSRSCPI